MLARAANSPPPPTTTATTAVSSSSTSPAGRSRTLVLSDQLEIGFDEVFSPTTTTKLSTAGTVLSSLTADLPDLIPTLSSRGSNNSSGSSSPADKRNSGYYDDDEEDVGDLFHTYRGSGSSSSLLTGNGNGNGTSSGNRGGSATTVWGSSTSTSLPHHGIAESAPATPFMDARARRLAQLLDPVSVQDGLTSSATDPAPAVSSTGPAVSGHFLDVGVSTSPPLPYNSNGDPSGMGLTAPVSPSMTMGSMYSGAGTAAAQQYSHAMLKYHSGYDARAVSPPTSTISVRPGYSLASAPGSPPGMGLPRPYPVSSSVATSATGFANRGTSRPLPSMSMSLPTSPAMSRGGRGAMQYSGGYTLGSYASSSVAPSGAASPTFSTMRSPPTMAMRSADHAALTAAAMAHAAAVSASSLPMYSPIYGGHHTSLSAIAPEWHPIGASGGGGALGLVHEEDDSASLGDVGARTTGGADDDIASQESGEVRSELPLRMRLLDLHKEPESAPEFAVRQQQQQHQQQPPHQRQRSSVEPVTVATSTAVVELNQAPKHIYVSDLPPMVDEMMLRRAFRRYGRIDDIRLSKTKASGALNGVAYVKFAFSDSVTRAIEGDGGDVTINGKVIKVAATDPTENPTKKLFFANVWDLTQHDLLPICTQFGEVTQVDVVADRGMMYVHFVRLDEALAAHRALQGLTINNRYVRVEFGQSAANYETQRQHHHQHQHHQHHSHHQHQPQHQQHQHGWSSGGGNNGGGHPYNQHQYQQRSHDTGYYSGHPSAYASGASSRAGSAPHSASTTPYSTRLAGPPMDRGKESRSATRPSSPTQGATDPRAPYGWHEEAMPSGLAPSYPSSAMTSPTLRGAAAASAARSVPPSAAPSPPLSPQSTRDPRSQQQQQDARPSAESMSAIESMAETRAIQQQQQQQQHMMAAAAAMHPGYMPMYHPHSYAAAMAAVAAGMPMGPPPGFTGPYFDPATGILMGPLPPHIAAAAMATASSRSGPPTTAAGGPPGLAGSLPAALQQQQQQQTSGPASVPNSAAMGQPSTYPAPPHPYMHMGPDGPMGLHPMPYYLPPPGAQQFPGLAPPPPPPQGVRMSAAATGSGQLAADKVYHPPYYYSTHPHQHSSGGMTSMPPTPAGGARAVGESAAVITDADVVGANAPQA
ncbi:hypothetical protein BC828DRAFT_396558 [Blastocladiella britannica]|nr:hypothetical protein BC828DRAFT_396558 [Blastocladiella britannica]